VTQQAMKAVAPLPQLLLLIIVFCGFAATAKLFSERLATELARFRRDSSTR
jgi:hypothetical protein